MLNLLKMDSWYKSTVTDQAIREYISAIQNIWKVYNANMELVEYKLTPHQIEWHSSDIAILGSKAKDRVVVKSRNTSFTTSALISNLMAVPKYPNQILPFIRLNERRAYDLIEECKILIRNMTPVLKDDVLYPFDPRLVSMEKAGSIIFPNGVEFRAMPANASSAESIRGMRIFGSAGIIDESNFMMRFRNIYIALRDASRGSGIDGNKHFQMNIGTTRKGRTTNFNTWFEEILKSRPDNIKIFSWPVFEPGKVNLDRSLLTQEGLIPIVDWHNINDLENKRKEDLNTFKEEYMGELVDSEDILYRYEMLSGCVDSELILYQTPLEGEVYYMGVDPAATSDYFAVSIFNENKIQRFLYYSRGVPLKTMEGFCEELIKKWKPIKCRIDGNGLGYQLSQTLKNLFGHIVEVIRGVAAVKTPGKITGNVPMKEFLHTNQIKLMNYNEMALLPDDLQLTHYMSWKNDYTCPSTSELGHGDISVANGLALLPDKWRHSGSSKVAVVREKEVKEDIKILNEKQEEVEW